MPKQIGDMTLYTVLELSKLLDVTEVTLRRYIKDGKLKATLMGGKYLISEETLRELMQNGEQKTYRYLRNRLKTAKQRLRNNG